VKKDESQPSQQLVSFSPSISLDSVLLPDECYIPKRSRSRSEIRNREQIGDDGIENTPRSLGSCCCCCWRCQRSKNQILLLLIEAIKTHKIIIVSTHIPCLKKTQRKGCNITIKAGRDDSNYRTPTLLFGGYVGCRSCRST